VNGLTREPGKARERAPCFCSVRGSPPPHCTRPWSRKSDWRFGAARSRDEGRSLPGALLGLRQCGVFRPEQRPHGPCPHDRSRVQPTPETIVNPKLALHPAAVASRGAHDGTRAKSDDKPASAAPAPGRPSESGRTWSAGPCISREPEQAPQRESPKRWRSGTA
jgi:hypothetical protein